MFAAAFAAAFAAVFCGGVCGVPARNLVHARLLVVAHPRFRGVLARLLAHALLLVVVDFMNPPLHLLLRVLAWVARGADMGGTPKGGHPENYTW